MNNMYYIICLTLLILAYLLQNKNYIFTFVFLFGVSIVYIQFLVLAENNFEIWFAIICLILNIAFQVESIKNYTNNLKTNDD